MADQELIIKINGDVGDWQAALELAGEDTDKLKDQLEDMTKYAAVAFAALNVEIYEAVSAAHEHAIAIEQVNQALQNQGLAGQGLAAEYRDIAEAISAKTGVDADQISQGQAVGQSILGQTKITKEMTQAVVDFAAKSGSSVPEAFRQIARAVDTGTGRLQQYGITIEQGATRSERMTDILSQIQTQFGGVAEISATTTGSTELLTKAFIDMQKAIGAQLAPAFDLIVHSLTDLINYFNKHEEITTFIADVIIAATVVTGLATALGTAGIAFIAIRTAIVAAGLAAEAASIGFRLLAGATGIGLLVIVILELYQHWSTVWPAMQAVFSGFVTFIVAQANSLGEILNGIFHADPAKIKQGIDDWKASFSQAATAAVNTLNATLPKVNLTAGVNNAAEQAQDAVKAAAAKKREDLKKQNDSIIEQLNQAHIELLALQDSNASKDTIALKKEEIQTLTALANKKNGDERDQLLAHLQTIRGLEATQAEVQEQQTSVLYGDILANNAAFQEMTIEQRQEFAQKNQAAFTQQLTVKKTQLEAAAKAEAAVQIKANNQFLLDQQKFGTAYATINQAIHSEEFNAYSDASTQLAGLAKSKNATLKAIGQVAAESTIAIATAESAAKVFADAVILLGPFAGPPVGAALAAARIAYGAEQIAAVQGAAEGGLMEGGVPGVDSIPVMAQAGELIAPAKNFDEVVNAVADSRNGGALGGDDAIALLQSINSQLGQNGGGGNNQIINIQGDAIGDVSFLQALAQKISQGLEFGNLKIYGVNTGKRLI